jgi:tRNA(Ile)-lysidine synthase
VYVRFRQGGERFHPAGRQGSHPLKKLMQEWHIPPWQRDKVPLIYFNNELIAVVGYGVSKNYAVQENEAGCVLFVIARPSCAFQDGRGNLCL